MAFGICTVAPTAADGSLLNDPLKRPLRCLRPPERLVVHISRNNTKREPFALSHPPSRSGNGTQRIVQGRGHFEVEIAWRLIDARLHDAHIVGTK